MSGQFNAAYSKTAEYPFGVDSDEQFDLKLVHSFKITKNESDSLIGDYYLGINAISTGIITITPVLHS